jgi:hypothetical protein
MVGPTGRRQRSGVTSIEIRVDRDEIEGSDKRAISDIADGGIGATDRRSQKLPYTGPTWSTVTRERYGVEW